MQPLTKQQGRGGAAQGTVVHRSHPHSSSWERLATARSIWAACPRIGPGLRLTMWACASAPWTKRLLNAVAASVHARCATSMSLWAIKELYVIAS